jgi:predicted nucleic acid-binding Zn ribbon protein
MRITLPITRMAVAAAGALALLVTATPAQAGAHTRAPTDARHCVVVLAPLEAGETTSRVLSEECAATPEAAQRRSAAATGTLASTLLLVLYADINYGGASTRLEGAYGACDTAGYGFSDLGTWRNRISSFKRFNWCQRVAGYDNVNYGGALLGVWTADTPWVGSGANDRIDSILTRRL